jgi:hypothetical protein
MGTHKDDSATLLRTITQAHFVPDVSHYWRNNGGKPHRLVRRVRSVVSRLRPGRAKRRNSFAYGIACVQSQHEGEI